MQSNLNHTLELVGKEKGIDKEILVEALEARHAHRGEEKIWRSILPSRSALQRGGRRGRDLRISHGRRSGR